MGRQSKSTPLKPVTTWRCRLRQLRNGLVAATIVVVVAHTAGLPHLLWEYRYRGSRAAPVIDWGYYVGPNGRVRIDAWERPGGCPLIVFLKPGRPLWGLLGHSKENQP